MDSNNDDTKSLPDNPQPSDLIVTPEIASHLVQIPPSSKKGPSFDQNKQRLERLISDSHKRRSRYQKELGAANQTQEVKTMNKDIPTVSGSISQLDDRAGHMSEKPEDDHQYSEICERYSNFALTSNGSRLNKEQMFNKTVNITKAKSKPRKAPTNYLEKNKKQIEKGAEIAQQKPTQPPATKMWHQQLRGGVSNGSVGAQLAAKVAKAKINTNLRSTSAAVVKRGTTKSPAERSKDTRVKYGMASTERQNTENAEGKVNSKYSEIEDLILANMGSIGRKTETGPTESPQDNAKVVQATEQKPPLSASKKFVSPKVVVKAALQFATAQRSALRNASKNSLASQDVPTMKNKANPSIPHQTIELVGKKQLTKSASKPNSVQRTTISKMAKEKPQANQPSQSAREPLPAKPTRIGQRAQATRIQQSNKSPDRTAYSTIQDRTEELFQSSAPHIDLLQKPKSSQAEVSFTRHEESSSSAASSKEKSSPSRQKEKSDSFKSEDISPTPVHLPKGAGAGTATAKAAKARYQSNVFSNSYGNSMKSKDDIMNMNIENIWKEMEEIGRSKQAAHQLFQAFQEKYYDQSDPVFYDQQQESPTQRLISMKNATVKHHTIEYRKGITGRYAIQYTTCPEKSYVILPDEGQTDYDKYRDKTAHQFVQDIISARVEKVELEEVSSKRKKSSPNRQITNKSPVRISREHCQRGDLLGSFAQNVEEEDKKVDTSKDAHRQDKPDIEQRGVIYEENQNDELHEDSIINICSNGVNSLIVEERRSLSVGPEPQPQSSSPVPIPQDQQQVHEEQFVNVETVPFISDEQPITVENNSIISTTHEEAIQIFDSPLQPEVSPEHFEEPSEPVAYQEEEEKEEPVETVEEPAQQQSEQQSETPKINKPSEKKGGRRKGGKRHRY